MIPTKFRFIRQKVSEVKIAFLLTNQKQELPMATMFVNVSGQKSNYHRGPFIYDSY